MTNTEKQAIDPVVTDIDIAQISSCDTHSLEECVSHVEDIAIVRLLHTQMICL